MSLEEPLIGGYTQSNIRVDLIESILEFKEDLGVFFSQT